MANAEHLKILKEGVEVWNEWREENPSVPPDLSGSKLVGFDFAGVNFSNCDLRKASFSNCEYLNGVMVDMKATDLKQANLFEADLTGANLEYVKLSGANLNQSNLSQAHLSEADLSGASLMLADLYRANLTDVNLKNANLIGAGLTDTELSGADISNANLTHAFLNRANLEGCNLTGANLSEAWLAQANLTKAILFNANLFKTILYQASLLETDLSNANLQEAKIYGISVWDIKKEGLVQRNLVVTKQGEPEITVDDLEIAQFIYLLLNNQKFRDVIETVTSKAVLILGRFTDERKKVLDAIRDELRNRNFLPILFDFEKPATRDLTETISILAKLSRFVIADLTDAKSLPQELSHIIPDMPSLPVIPLILKGQAEYAMYAHWRRYPWVLPVYEYTDEAQLISTLAVGVLEPVEKMVQQIRSKA